MLLLCVVVVAWILVSSVVGSRCCYLHIVVRVAPCLLFVDVVVCWGVLIVVVCGV